jgi:hypothetical protein
VKKKIPAKGWPTKLDITDMEGGGGVCRGSNLQAFESHENKL